MYVLCIYKVKKLVDLPYYIVCTYNTLVLALLVVNNKKNKVAHEEFSEASNPAVHVSMLHFRPIFWFYCGIGSSF